MSDLEDFIKNLKISQKLKDQLDGNTEVITNLKRISKYQEINKNLYYNFAVRMDNLEENQIQDIIKCIDKNLISNENMLIKSFELIKEENFIENYTLFEYISKIDFDEEKLKQIMNKFDNLKEIMNFIRHDDELVFYDSQKAIVFLKSQNIKSTKVKRKGILHEGELKFLHKPGENPQLDSKIMNEHLKRTGGAIITRFPPEPNGFLHIGHAKAMYLDFNYGNKCIMRFDDTNPKNEMDEYYDAILDDLEWMGYKPWKITCASDYFDQMIIFAKQLIIEEKAYVCHLTTEEIKAQILSPYRERSKELNLNLFQEMIDGKWKEGSAILRLKMDMNSKDMMMHDLIAYRIINIQHSRTKKKYFVYPSYDFTHCINDSLEDITHSFCSREFFGRKSSYNWLLDALKIYKPVQWEFSRLNVSNTILSKRKLNVLVNQNIVTGWDDPRLFTLKGLKRRGVPPDVIKEFIEEIGITFNETIIDVKKFEHILRQNLKNKRSINIVFNPFVMKIINDDEILIDQDDFSKTKDKDYFRLTPDQPVGLMNKFIVEFIKQENDIITVKQTEKKCLSRIQFLSTGNNIVKFKVRELSPLFKSFNPEESSFLDDINPDSMKIIEAFANENIKTVQKGEVVQFFRKGWYCRDEDENGQIVFNKTIDMKK